MYHTARPERRAAVGGLLLSLGLTSFLTGVTEPVEFTFMFLAPVLYVLHAIATGLAMVLMHLVHVRLGFSFSAGLFDYVLNFSHAEHPLLLLPIGAAYFALYYGVFRIAISRLNLATPGREIEVTMQVQWQAPTSAGERARAFIGALGGGRNVTEVAACTTRLRLVLADNTAVNDTLLKQLGARGVLRTSGGLQVVLGPIADQVAGDIRTALRSVTAAAPPTAAATAGYDAPALLAALGGRANVAEVETAAGRLLIRTAQPDSVDERVLGLPGVRGIARTAADKIQVIVAGAAEDWAVPLRRLL
jgi:PTS system N-acetylglucosamine-specific IIC component